MIGEYEVLRDLGSGSTGTVKLARHTQYGFLCAIKIIKKSDFLKNPDLKSKIYREIALMRLFKHAHILKLIEVCESPHHLYIVLEYAENGELFHFLVARRTIGISLAMNFFRQLIYGLEYLHGHAICHRDLKPENILLTEFNDIKIADFGFARWMKQNIAETCCGSPHYAAPEVVRGTPYDGRTADIWSSGVILYALLAGRLPFADPIVRNLLRKVKSGEFVMPQLPPDIQNLIRSILTVDTSVRITIEQIKQHPAFRIGIDNPSYVLPVPLPVCLRPEPIAIDSVPRSALTILQQIGFSSDEELKEELEMDGFSMAKVFSQMLMATNSLEILPWEANTASDDGRLIELIQPCIGIAMPLERLLVTMQELFESLGFQWFHPDDCTLVARVRGGKAGVIATVHRQSADLLNMDLQFTHATEELIVAVSDRLKSALSGE
jgi:serine/threonine protein kinase